MGTCWECGKDVTPGQPFCGHCGSSQGRTCPACASRAHVGDRFCPSCGSPLAAAGLATAEDLAGGALAPPNPERRLVSVLFADLVGFTTLAEGRDPEDVRELLSLYFARCKTIIDRYGGVVEKFIGDAVMAVWGAPVAKEDDAERAVRAALALTEAVSALGGEVGMSGLRIRAGVLTGTAAVDAPGRHEGMVHGDTVNTAARLQSIAAPATVLVDDVTRRATEAAIAYEDAGTHQVKGRVEPVRAWTALRVVAGVGGARRTAGLEAPLAGRAGELQTIVDAGERSANESRAVRVTVIGDAGLGKSRLAWEYFKYVDGIGEERWWHQGRCPHLRRGPRVLGARRDDPRAGRHQRGRGAGLRASEAAGLRGALRLRRARARPGAAAAGASARPLAAERQRAGGPVQRLEAVPRADGGHRPGGARVRGPAVGDRRPAGLHRLPARVVDGAAAVRALPRAPDLPAARSAGGETIRLAALEPPDMHALLGGLVPGLPRDVAARIVDRAEGVPLYAVETVRMLLDRGLLLLDGARYVPGGDLERLEVPETLQALAASRLDSVGRGERMLLQDAAVIGTSFTPEALAAISGRRVADLTPVLDTLVAKQLLGRDDDERVAERGQYHFLQALLRTVALSTLARRDRRARHLAAAEYIGSLPGQTGEMAELQASHLLDAVALDPDAEDADEIRARAREKLAIAGERTGSLALPEPARHHFEQAAALAREPGERARLLAQAGAAANRAGAREDALALLGEAIETLEAGGEVAEAARTRALLADVLIGQLRLDEAGALMDRARESIADEIVLAELAARRAHVALLAGDYERAYTEAETALAIADPAGMLAVVADAQITKAQTLFDRHRLIEAVALCSLALDIGLEADLGEPALRAYNNLAYYREQGGQPEEAIELLDAGVALARERGDRPWERDLISQRVSIRAYHGEWDGALAEGEALREHGEDMAERVAWHARPLILAARGDIAGLAEWLDRELTDSPQWQEQSLDEAVARATALRAVGRAEEAAALAELAWREVEAVGRATSDLAMYFSTLVDGLLEDGRVEALRRGLPAGTHPLPAMRGQLAWARGLLRLREDELDAALAELGDAVALLRAVDHPFALARALLDHGDCHFLLGRRASAAEALTEARSIFARLGATPSLERTESALSACSGVRFARGQAVATLDAPHVGLAPSGSTMTAGEATE